MPLGDPWPIVLIPMVHSSNALLLILICVGCRSQALVPASFCLDLNNGRFWWDTGGRTREKPECFLVHLSASDGIFSSDCNSSMAPAPIRFTCCCSRFFGMVFYNSIFSLCLSSVAVATASFLSLTYGLPPTTSSVPHL